VSERPVAREDERDRDRDLPGLLEWGDVLLEATGRAEAVRAGAPGRRRRWLAPRRAIPALAAVFALLVPGAVVATRSIWDDPIARVGPRAPAPSSPAVRLVVGATGDVRWRIGGWNASGGRICLRTEAFRGGRPALVSQACLTPQTAARLTMSVGTTDTLSLVVGTTSTAVASVRVAPPAGQPVRVAARALPAGVLRRSGLRDAARVYVAVFPRGFQQLERPPLVTGYDARGHALATTAGGAR
jgi:hypothetical protein